MELFWKGVRDWLNCQPKAKRKGACGQLWDRYMANFHWLREQICEVGSCMKTPRIRKLKLHNYATDGEGTKERVVENLRNTEFDIVLETDDSLFIGEAKHECSFSASSSLVLVHQLVRQYVTAKVLLDVTCSKKALVPFVVGDRRDHLFRTSQVRLMTHLRWPNSDVTLLDEGNVLSWKCVRSIVNGSG